MLRHAQAVATTSQLTRRWGVSWGGARSRFSNWSFVSGMVSLPHPEKKQGEDSAFCTPTALGVADGVGGWARKGIDSGAYSRMLMAACESSTLTNPKDRLTEAYRATNVPGSSTACVVHLNGTSLSTINVGDSGFLMCRQQGDNKWSLLYASPSQCHYFNCPFQLGMGSRDTPEHGDVQTLPAQPNDLVLVATDGLFDNLSTPHLLELLNLISAESLVQGHDAVQAMAFMATTVGDVAHDVAKSHTRLTPFALAARQAGYKDTAGGKMDDITVVAALVQE
ncbi:hypothetical protein H257_05879 [Aphanomyces astaci]|uniref:Protein phosphatase n=2 Tax=Aphanomyces astaci TaxID=112090 RepID=W4GNP6_APHAT|nr:hypothetical protein H257_05879 [Aphanomyces astaci]ETV81332.1 hypothetical protein H257_05879 [Aphanomyces astaci]|eukprot:XP_009829190.1 hypothetical protein H257_05879 [Aphanomyces astaci]